MRVYTRKNINDIFKSRWKKIKDWFTLDHIIDVSVDMSLLLFDVLTTPILIPIRIARFYLKKYMILGIKKFIKYETHVIDDKIHHRERKK